MGQERRESRVKFDSAVEESTDAIIDKLPAATVKNLLSGILRRVKDYEAPIASRIAGGFEKKPDTSKASRDKYDATWNLINKIRSIQNDEQGKSFLKNLGTNKDLIKIMAIRIPEEKGLLNSIKNWFNEQYLSIFGTKGLQVREGIRKLVADVIREERKNIKESLKQDAKVTEVKPIEAKPIEKAATRLGQAPSSSELPMARPSLQQGGLTTGKTAEQKDNLQDQNTPRMDM